jgi:hypothetical protein
VFSSRKAFGTFALILAVVIAGGGAWYYLGKSKEEISQVSQPVPPSQNSTTAASSTATSTSQFTFRLLDILSIPPKDQSSDNAKEDIVAVYKQGEPESMQTLAGFPISADIASSAHIEQIDANFDGYPDVRVARDQGATGNTSYDYWLSASSSGLFIYNSGLSDDGINFLLPSQQEVGSHSNRGCGGSCYSDTFYRYNGNDLVLVRTESYDVVGTYFRKEIQEIHNGEMATVSVTTSTQPFPTQEYD